MKTTNTFRREYIARFNRVLDFIDQHLADELRLEQLAAVALFSPFHFHRLFQLWQGETLADYVRRRRLELAAGRLLNNQELSVLSVALDCGFGSGESFARAFRQQFACTPTSWRRRKLPRNRKMDQVDGKLGQVENQETGDNTSVARLCAPDLLEEALLMNQIVKIEHLPAVRIAYMRRTGAYGPGIGELWGHFKKWCAARGFLGERMMFGLFLDDPEITEPALCRYDVSIEVDAAFKAEGEVAVRELPSGLYALLDFYGDQPACGEAWDSLIASWLPQSGYQMDDRPCFERYRPDERYDPATGSFGCQIAIAIRPV